MSEQRANGSTVSGELVLSDTAEYALRLGDDALILSQRLSEWSARSPQIEEDIALMNIALDLLGQARSLLSYAGEQRRPVRGRPGLPARRSGSSATSSWPNWTTATSRPPRSGNCCSPATSTSSTATCRSPPTTELAAIAGKAVKEVSYHLEHSAAWVCRLGDGTELSHDRSQAALDAVWPYTHELFVDDPLIRTGGRPAASDRCRPACANGWLAAVLPVLAEATLTVPGGRLAARRRPARACTPRASATCSPSCSTCTDPIPARNGDRRRPARRSADCASRRSVPDPEIPVLTIAELGILRDVRSAGDGRPEVVLTPTYSGCPATEAIRQDVLSTAPGRSTRGVEVVIELAPAWTTDWITETGRRKLAEYGIAPPRPTRSGPVPVQLARPAGQPEQPVRCPRCEFAEHRADQPVRLHPVQGAAPLPGLRRTVRRIQATMSVFHKLTVARAAAADR